MRINVDMACVGCGYNLRTLAVNGRCPECGRRVGDSIERYVTTFSVQELSLLKRRNMLLVLCIASVWAFFLCALLVHELLAPPFVAPCYFTCITLSGLVACIIAWPPPTGVWTRVALAAMTAALAVRTVLVWAQSHTYDLHLSVAVMLLLSVGLGTYLLYLRSALPFDRVGVSAGVFLTFVVMAALGAVMAPLNLPTEHAVRGLPVFVNFVLLVAGLASLVRTNAGLAQLVPSSHLTAVGNQEDQGRKPGKPEAGNIQKAPG